MECLPFKGRLLICDMDGTLLDSNSRLSKGNKVALERFVAGGGLFTVATGRMEKSVMQYLQDLPVNLPAIVYNGAAIYDFQTNRKLWQSNLVPGIIEPVKKVIDRFPDIGVEFYHEGMTYYVRENRYTFEHMLRECFEPFIVSVDEVPQPWSKVILAWDPNRLPEVEEFLKSFQVPNNQISNNQVSSSQVSNNKGSSNQMSSNQVPFTQVYSEPQFLELLNHNVSKGSALKVMIEMLDLDKTCVISMGDNLNDLELIREANVGIAVENAHEALKEAADLCCCHHNLNAVSEVINWLENNKIVC